jgi:hypothetical protein
MKALITAASLAATLGGWATLAIEQAATTTSVEAPSADVSVADRPAAEITLNLPLLPTIAAPPPPPPRIVVERSSVATGRPAAPAAAQPVPAAQPIAPAAQPAPAANLPLRVVSAPPQPVARTHSSR